MQFSKIDSVSFCGTINYSAAYFWHFSCFRVITEIKQKPNAVEDAHAGTLILRGAETLAKEPIISTLW